VIFTFRNSVESEALTFLFETLPPEEEFDQATRLFRTVTSSSLRSRYLWSGVTKKRVVALEPNTTMELRLCATFFHPGHYNLNRYRLTVFDAKPEGPKSSKATSKDGKSPRVFFFTAQHLIFVTDGTKVPEA